MRRAGRSYSPSPCEQRAITWARIAHCFRAIIAEFFDSGQVLKGQAFAVREVGYPSVEESQGGQEAVSQLFWKDANIIHAPSCR
jgi:hypothetical protein